MFKIFKQMNTENNSSQPLQVFNSPQFGQIRTAGTSDEPLFCLVDIARALEYSNPAKAVLDHCKGVTVLETPTNGGIQKIKFGKESEVYRLIMKSNTEKAEAFQDWVCGEVLPSIRKNGAYVAAQPDESPELLMARALKAADEAIQRQKQQLQEANQHIAIAEETIEQNERQLKEQAPKVMFADAVATSEQSVLVKDVATVLTQNGVKIGQNRLFQYMRDHGYLGRNGEYYNQPTQRAMEMGLFELKKTTIQKPDGTVLVTTTPKVTGKGQIYFVNHLLKERA